MFKVNQCRKESKEKGNGKESRTHLYVSSEAVSNLIS